MKGRLAPWLGAALAAVLNQTSIAAHAQPARVAPTSVALFYEASPPLAELAAFDWVVVEPAYVPRPPPSARTEFFAYVSIGEINRSRGYFAELPSDWHAGVNADWGTIVVDQRADGWPAFLVERIVRPLWEAGYRGFFLDTLDSFRIVATSDADFEAQRRGLIRAIRALRSAFPAAKLVFNRGFEVLPDLHPEVAAVAAESLFQSWSQRDRSYGVVAQASRDELLGILRKLADHGLPIIVIDYVAPTDRELARRTAQRIRALGFVPWVADAQLSMLGVGAVEVLPRRLLIAHDGAASGPIDVVAEWLGLIVERFDFSREDVRRQPLAGLYAGVVINAATEDERHVERLAPLVRKAREQGVRVAVLGRFGVPRGHPADTLFDLQTRAGDGADPPSAVRIVDRHPSIGYEVAPLPDRREFVALRATSRAAPADPLDIWLRVADARGDTMDAVAITPWGGYALAPYDLLPLPAGRGTRWIIDPVVFLRAALALPVMPLPDVTTAVGRRMLFARADSEGLEERVEGAQPKGRSAFDALATDLLPAFAIPTGLRLAALTAPQRERIGRFPHVEDETAHGHDASRSAPLTRADRSITRLAPLLAGAGVPAASPNELAYTNQWNGPFYGYQRAIETFELADAPRRWKPIEIHYRGRALTKRASFEALRRVHEWARAQDAHPVMPSAFGRMASDFLTIVVARTPDGFLVRGMRELRELRLPVSLARVDLTASHAIAGFTRINDEIYLHASADEARVRLALDAPRVPYIESANGTIRSFERTPEGFRAQLVSHWPLSVSVTNTSDCAFEPEDRSAAPIAKRAGDTTTYQAGNTNGGSRATLVCRG